jgi:hypothetical protein
MIEIGCSDDKVRVECSKMKDWESWPTEFLRFKSHGRSGLLLPADDVGKSTDLQPGEIKILEALALDVFKIAGASARQISDATGKRGGNLYQLLSSLKVSKMVSQSAKGDPFKITNSGRQALEASLTGGAVPTPTPDQDDDDDFDFTVEI